MWAYSNGENFTLIMDERLSRAKQVQIKFGKFIIIFQKTSQVLQGEYPSSLPSSPHVPICINCDIEILAILPWIYENCKEG